jgi:hypothetical protein
MDPIIQLRFRQTVAILIAAVVTAAAARHFAHVDGGLSREEIRAWALIGVGVLIGVLGATLFFRRQQ